MKQMEKMKQNAMKELAVATIQLVQTGQIDVKLYLFNIVTVQPQVPPDWLT